MSTAKKLGIGVGVVIGVLLILWFFQSQGLIKVFPTSQEREVGRILELDESKFVAAEGLSDEDFQTKIEEAYSARDVVRENPTDAAAWMDFGGAVEFLNDHEKAIEAWKQVLIYQDLNFVAAHNIANNYQYFIRDFSLAEEYYLQALEIRPDYTLAYQGLMDLYRFNLTSKTDQYEPLLLQAIREDFTNAGSYYVALVEFFASKGDLEKAREYLDDAENANPQAAATLRADYPGL